jgi:hypothetical protein
MTGAGNFFLRHHIEIISGVHPASSTMGTRALKEIHIVAIVSAVLENLLTRQNFIPDYLMKVHYLYFV